MINFDCTALIVLVVIFVWHCHQRLWIQYKSVYVCLLFCILATSKIISGRILTCDSVHSWWHYSAAISTMTCYPTQSHYPDTEPISPYLILIMPSTWLGSNKYQFDKSLVWLNHGFEPTISCPRDPCSTDSAMAPAWVSLWVEGHDIYCYCNIL